MRTTYNGGVEGSYNSFSFRDGFTSSGKDTDPYHFATLDHDADSYTEHAEFRQYSSAQGRWLSPDPSSGSYDMGNPQSLNRYVYVLNNPLSMTDPKGLDPPCEKNSDDGAPMGSANNCSDAIFAQKQNGIAPIQGQNVVLNVTLQVQGPTETVEVNADDDPPVPTGGGGAINVEIPYEQTSSLPLRAPSNGSAPSTCQATLLNMANQQLRTNFNDNNVVDFYRNGKAYNIIIQSSQLTSAQFNNIQQGRYPTYGMQWLFGAGVAGHVADETNLGFSQSAFIHTNVGGNLYAQFAFHDDHGFAANPIGFLIHWLTDVLGHNSRKPC